MIEKYKKFTQSKSDTDSMDHIVYLLRTTLRNKGIQDFSVNYRDYDICISVFCYEAERLNHIINIFDILNYIKTDIIPQYDSEFDMYQTRKNDNVLEFNFFYNSGNGDDFDNE